MHLSTFCLKHPVVTIVINCLLIVIGVLSFQNLSVREYPKIDYPKLTLYTHYPSASPEVIENKVTAPLEDKLAGLTNLATLKSMSSYGTSRIMLKFKGGTSMQQALFSAREAVSLVRLPADVKPPIITKGSSSDNTPFVALSLKADHMDMGDLTHYAQIHLENRFRSLPGVSRVQIWGQPYTYKIELDHRKLRAFNLTVEDIFTALNNSHHTLPAGTFYDGVPINIQSHLNTAEDFGDVWIKNNNGTPVYLKTVAKVIFSTNTNQFRSRIDGKPNLIINIYKTSDGNPVALSRLIKKEMINSQSQLPHEMSLMTIIDQGVFVEKSISHVRQAILEAIICVLVVIFLFLRSGRSILVPLATIPLSLLGGFVFLQLFGCSINLLTLLAIVLAIGLVVDDAIVVLEHVQKYIEKGLSPYQAALKAGESISFSVIAMTLTLASVYVPLAFIQGTAGQLFVEFAVALAGSVIISGFVALTLSPLMCAHLLSPAKSMEAPKVWIVLSLYKKSLGFFIQKQWVTYGFLCLSVVLSYLIITTLPKENAPKEDQGLINIRMPDRQNQDVASIEKKLMRVKRQAMDGLTDIQHALSFAHKGVGQVVLVLSPGRKQSSAHIAHDLKNQVQNIPSTDVFVSTPDTNLPGIHAESDAGSLSMVIGTTGTYQDLFESIKKAIKHMREQGDFTSFGINARFDIPQYTLKLDQMAMNRLGIRAQTIAKTLQVFLDTDESQTFTKDGVSYYMIIQSKDAITDINSLYITTQSGQSVSIGAVAELVPSSGPTNLPHYNKMRSVILSTDIPQGMPLNKAMSLFKQQLDASLPEQLEKYWTGKSKALKKGLTEAAVLFVLSLIFIYAIMAIQFESFLDPFIILLTVPFACFGGLLFVWLSGGAFNIYTQIGLVTLIGLITKHGILIVSFVNQQSQNIPLVDRILQAASLRLRPILMTSGAMVMGTIPLIISTDMGHESRQAIGIVLLGGLVVGTVLTLFVLPSLCYSLKGRRE